uniref:Secreted protein n=1 Tax=Haemonchus contortus TaxID=6289 RepID=A0A7I4Y7J9_HAECO
MMLYWTTLAPIEAMESFRLVVLLLMLVCTSCWAIQEHEHTPIRLRRDVEMSLPWFQRDSLDGDDVQIPTYSYRPNFKPWKWTHGRR